MNKKNQNKSTAHIVLNRFSVAERQLIREAVASQQTRRPVFYHDAIIAYAKEAINATYDSEADRGTIQDQ